MIGLEILVCECSGGQHVGPCLRGPLWGGPPNDCLLIGRGIF